MNTILKTNNYDLENRTVIFAESLLSFLKTLKENSYNKNIVSQVIKSGCSIGANYCEAIQAESRKDFTHKSAISRKESKETCYWLRLLAKIHPEKRAEILVLWKESHELLLIFSKIVRSSKLNQLDPLKI
jgi:four helix bundle protein